VNNQDLNPTIRLSFLPAEDRVTPARTGEIARAATADLRTAGYTITPADTGERGGPVYDLIMYAAQAVHDNQDMLKALVGLATPIVTALITWHQKQPTPADTPPQDLEVVVTIAGATASAHSLAEANDAALLHQLLTAQPGLSSAVAPTSPITIAVKVPAKPAHRKSKD
jgi:hypothetical protein